MMTLRGWPASCPRPKNAAACKGARRDIHTHTRDRDAYKHAYTPRMHALNRTFPQEEPGWLKKPGANLRRSHRAPRCLNIALQ